MKLPRVGLYLSVVAAAVVLFIGFGAWLIPRLIDSQLIKDKISSELAKKTPGNLTFGQITVLWLPRPSVVIENAEIAFGRQTQGTIRWVKIYPSIFYLLTGRWVVHQALLEQARFQVRLPQGSVKPINLEELQNEIRAALVVLTSHWPAPRIDLSDGSAEITIGNQPPLIVANLAAQTVISPGALNFDLQARSNLWERLKIAGRTSLQEVTLELDIGVERLKLKESLKLLALPSLDYLQAGEASLEIKVAGVGTPQLKASVDGSIGPVALVRHGGTMSVEAKRLKAAFTYGGGALHANLEQLELGTPRLQASGTLKMLADSCALAIELRNADVAQLGELALQLADDPERVKSLLRYLPAGTLSEMKIHSAAGSIAEMAARKNIEIAATLRNGKVVVPDPALEFTNVATALRIGNDILEAKEISAELGAAKAWNGKLRLGLAGKTAPFHLDTELHTSAPQLHAILLKLVADEKLRRELLNVQKPEGELSGRLILGETLAAISPVVAVSKANISATYAPLSLPIKISGARLDFDPSGLRIENAQGSVGRSSFAGFGVIWHHDGSRRIKVDAARLSLDLQQWDAAVRSFPALRPYFTQFQSARGQLDLDKLAFSGAYDEPAGWTWVSTGRFTQVEIERMDFPERISLSRGKFAADQGRIVFSDTTAALSDASFVGDGTFDYKRGAPIQFETRGSASIGAQMTQSLSHFLTLPDAVKLQSPLAITAKRFGWRAGGDISFAGEVAVAGGPQLSIDVVQRPQALALPNLTIDDDGRRARITLQLAKERLALTFSGELAAQTLDKIFASFPLQGAALSGDIDLSTDLAAPSRFSARGQLSGNNLLLPWGTDKVLIEGFHIEADGARFAIRSAALRWGQSRLKASGEVSAVNERIGLNLDVTGDHIDWQQLVRSFGGSASQQQRNELGVLSMPALEGAIRFNLERMKFERFNTDELVGTADISPTGIRTTIQHAVVCGITTTGRVDVAGQDIAVDLQLAAANAQLEPATTCLTNRQNDIRGTYSLTARLSGHGQRDQLRSALNGDFQLAARDGEFVRSPGIDATFDYLNSTGDFKVAFPDLDRETFPYRLVGIKGRLDRNLLIGDEVSIESSSLNLSGQGRVDLERMEIDGKGLIAVLKPIDQVISRIPGVGSMFGGTLVGIPVRVRGSVERPDVSYLSAADIGTELMSIPLRILGLPLGAMRLFTPSGQPRDEETSK